MSVNGNKRRTVRNPVSCAVYYSDGVFHASGVMENLTTQGGCVRGTHTVKVGMELVVLLIPPAQRAFLIKRAKVRWVSFASFGMELRAEDCGPVGELEDEGFRRQSATISLMTH